MSMESQNSNAQTGSRSRVEEDKNQSLMITSQKAFEQRPSEKRPQGAQDPQKVGYGSTIIDGMKNQFTIQRPKSIEKATVSTTGSTGGSQSFTQHLLKKPYLRLNTNLVNNTSIGSAQTQPQTTANIQSATRNLSYQSPHGMASANSTQPIAISSQRSGVATSTPKSNQSSSITNSTNQQPHQNYSSSLLLQSSKHRSQLSGSSLKQGMQGSQGGNAMATSAISNVNVSGNGGLQEMTNFASKIINQQPSQTDIVRVGTQIPKTTTAANLKNFNNLRQFNQILNQQQQQKNKQSVSSASATAQQQLDQSAESIQKHQSQSLLQNHQRHLQQQRAETSGKHQHQSKIELAGQKLNKAKNLQIAIPSSPREDVLANQLPSQREEQKSIHQHSGSQSTTNANAGNIKVNKFTCHSTRNASQKTSIFAQKKPQPDDTPTAEDNQAQLRDPQRMLEINQQEVMSLQPAHKIIIPNHESTKHSLKRNGVVRAYAANTNQGLVRTYNEDRVSIILNILKPPNRQIDHWPRCSFFGIYDGHGGSACADYLRDNLHQFVIKESCFPSNPKEALRIGFANAEKKFLELCQNENGIIDKSGSCAIVALIVEDMCYIANVGDSRAILSSEQGQKIFPLSRDHKPSDDLERKRIVEGGGQIYHRTATAPATTQDGSVNPNKKDVIVGPLRVLPGRLSVSRTFGDAEAKIEKFGGNSRVVIATPEIKQFKISGEHDFVVLGCDGIFDKLSNEETIECVWNSVSDNKTLSFANNVHKQSGMGVEYILKNSLLRRTLDNVTVVLIAFSNFKHACFGQGSGKKSGDGSSSKRRSKQRPTAVSSHQSIANPDTSSLSQDPTTERMTKIRNQHSIEEAKKKENIPPDRQAVQSSKVTASSGRTANLTINTTQQSCQQAPKSTTNAQLQRAEQISNSYCANQGTGQIPRKLQPTQPQAAVSTVNNQKRYFDFSGL